MNAKGHKLQKVHGEQLSRLPRLLILHEQDRWKEFINSLKTNCTFETVTS
ncbi:hypothetical protein GW17_00031760 [Ensete ventricosum]|nr:hypothetical protein GW17_00031760 [Ensete ventricosum]RZR81490.1 hypothetical protein BHM03_00007771 [Ensete ventricosum]